MERWSNMQCFLVFLVSHLYTALASLEPKFDMPMVNVTAQEKTTAELPCSVSSLGNYQVVWTDQFSTLLTYEDRRIIDDERLSIERPFTRDWNLHIRDVRYSDQGIYNCQINTNPVKVKTVNLIVLVPAKIVEHMSTTDVTVREGETVTMVCNVTGTPQPTVTWYRAVKDAKGIDKQKVGMTGEVLIIHNVTRFCGDKYECVAFNGVPPADTKQIEVFVEFAPEIYLPNRRIGQEKGKETILECTVTAFPHAVTMWMKDGVKIGTSTLKYRVELYDEDKNQLTLSLRVFNIQDIDFGAYTCVASNPLGEDEETMYLYDYTDHTKTTSTTSPSLIMPATHKNSVESPVVHMRPTANSDRYQDHKPRDRATSRPYYTSQSRHGDSSDNKISVRTREGNTTARTRGQDSMVLLMVVILILFILNLRLS